MMQVQVEIDLSGEQSRVNIHQLAREDATPDERGYAQAIEDVLVGVLQQAHEQAGAPLDVAYIVETEVERLRRLLREAQPHICAYGCPSVWKTGERPPHSELCRAMQEALGSVEGDAGEKPNIPEVG